jgi:lysophospholipase L1-like esterase
VSVVSADRPQYTVLRFSLALIVFLCGMATLGADSIKWLTLTVAFFSMPLLCQFMNYSWLRFAGLWWGFFLVLQTLISPLVPGINYVTLPANFERVVNVRGGLPGISGIQRVTTDQHGFRVNNDVNYESAESFRIFVIGASTTEEIYLDDARTWTSKLQEGLSQQLSSEVEVINTGLSGVRTPNHVATLEKILPMNPDMAIFLMGVNDWNHQIRTENRALFHRLITNKTEAFWLSNTLLGKLINSYKLSLANSGTEEGAEIADEFGEYYENQRGSLSRVDVRDYQLTEVSRSYRDNTNRISDICMAQQIACVFLTQPTGYAVDAAEILTARFWMTPPNESYTLSLGAMAEVASVYNQYMRAFGSNNNHSVCDIAAELEPSIENYYDDCHFSETGASRVADLVQSCLSAQGLVN